MNYDEMSREQLVAALSELTAASSAPQTTTQRLLHDLQVHQVELEMQNHELRDTYSALEESRNRYADLYDFAPIAYCTLDTNGLILELNLTAATLFGREREQVIGRPFTSLVTMAEPARFWHHLGTCAARGEPVVTEFSLESRGRHIDVEAVSVPVLGIGPKPRAFRTAFTDVTQRKRAEAEREAALKSEHLLRERVELLAEAHMAASQELATPGSVGMADVMRVIARHAQQLAQASWVQLELSTRASASETAGSEIKLGVRSQGEQMPSLTLPLTFGGRALAQLSLGRAAVPFSTDERRALELLCDALSAPLEIARLKAMDAVETLRLSLLEQVSAQLRQANDRKEVKTALSKIAREVLPSFADICLVHLVGEQALTLHCVRHMDPQREQALEAALLNGAHAQPLARWLKEVARASTPSLFRWSARDSMPPAVPDHWRTVLQLCEAHALIVAPLYARNKLLGTLCFARQSDDGYDMRLMAWAHEMAERCAGALDAAMLMEELREALTFRENLTVMITHDLRSPLNTISLTASALTPTEPIEERRRSKRHVQIIQRSAAHMNNMINDLLVGDVLKRDELRLVLREESVADIVNEACQLIEPIVVTRAVTLRSEVSESLPRVRVDRERVLRVFSNVIGNAAKFTPHNGQIVVTAKSVGDKIRVSISDSGPGVPPAQRAQLFDRYWKADRGTQGLGLGLYIAKSIIEAHGGRIWVEESAPPGATFSFELPAVDQH